MRKLLIAALALGLAAPAFAAEPTTTAKPKAKDDPNRVVCRREHVVGSNRPQKICMTVAERERLKDSAQSALDPSKNTIDRGAVQTQSGQ